MTPSPDLEDNNVNESKSTKPAPAHTPGPWHVNAHTNVMADGGLVAFPGIAAGFDQKANARLIAAAPDLLLALEMLLDWHVSEMPEDEEFSAVRDARAAIAKATGEQA